MGIQNADETLFTVTYFRKGTNSLGDRIVGATVETTPGFVNLNESSRKLGSKLE
jgi:hypothetical protein